MAPKARRGVRESDQGSHWFMGPGLTGQTPRRRRGHLLKMETFYIRGRNDTLHTWAGGYIFRTSHVSRRVGQGGVPARTVKSDLWNQDLGSNPDSDTYLCGLGQGTYPP